MNQVADSEKSSLRVTYFNGVPLHQLGPNELVNEVRTMLSRRESHVIHFLAVHPVTIAKRDPLLRSVLCRASINIPDGLPLVWALRALGGVQARRITATDGLRLLSEATADSRIGHFFLGSSHAVLARLTDNLTSADGKLWITGTHSPPYREISDAELDAISREIRAARTDILWIGLGAPKQNFVAERLRNRRAAPVIITIGAAFDFAAGVKRRAPAWMQRVGLEWLFRLLQEPRRLGSRYVVSNSQFIVDTARAVWTMQASRRHA